MPSEASSNQCAACKKPATNVCGGCRDAPLETKQTYYCNAACQKSDRRSHKARCMRLQTRRAFYRAGSTLQEIFYLFREILFDRLIVRTEEKNGKFYIHEGEYDLLINEYGIPYQTELGILYPFPSDVVVNPKDKHAVLSYLACGDAWVWLSEILKKLFEGIVSLMLRMDVSLQHLPRETIALNVLGEPLMKATPQHEVLEVSLKHGGERYVLDLAGAQYGFHDPIMQWDNFMHLRVGSLNYYNVYEPSGAAREELSKWEDETVIDERVLAGRKNLSTVKEKAITDHKVLMCRSVARISYKGSLMLDECIMKWEVDNEMSLAKTIQLPQAEFERTQKDLLQFCRAQMTLWLEDVKAGKYSPTV